VPKPLRHGYRSITELVSKFDCDVYSSESTDPEVIYQLASKAIQAMREMRRPAFLHLKYYRYLEHVGVNEDFAQGYRDRQEFERWRANDPVELQRKKLVRLASEAEVKKLEDTIERQVTESVKRAEKAPFPKPGELYQDVLA